ncbi:hypothetical protein TVAG_100970 [Trichomonas vaginalis G3]|uniref:Uncharacterized protein n=1 Tax=Trichomonas vaginalis (strain ATCC PRA-98 / G3) TaxID=412133 RepID=A2DJI1_TRIV3|nr:P-loop containing nucleoside triphosphate hydrolases family [Trichomonas vaginalis G3]EAY19381.1 hypothetical protein TVAG_100970 [Trichomonas vaginalis G3]KAI5493225.1 P-loop containing nucleoside triphosphate hydrolases family [Trichomonas vaginalis G3]|eukprot:XP_001580367.1 hypothetical protein [Trichomonas vaginalis G3]
MKNGNDAQPKQKKIVYINKFDFPEDPSKKIFLPKKQSQLLSLATDALDLPRDAQQVFDTDGNVITNIDDIQPKQKLLISCTKPLPDPELEPKYKSRQPTGRSIRPVIIPKQPDVIPPRDDAEIQQSLAFRNISVKEGIRNSLVSLYNNLSPQHKAQLESSEALKQLNEQNAKYLFDTYLSKHFICPTLQLDDNDIGKMTWEYALNVLKGKRPEDINITVTGPIRSGKTTLVSMLASLTIEKLIISNEIQNILPIIVNWSNYQPYSGDIHKLFDILCDATFEALNATKPQFKPVLDQIKQWITKAQSESVFPAFPPILQQYKDLPFNHITVVGTRLSNHYNNYKSNPRGYIQEVANFPANLAQAFGYNRILYIYDNFDTTAFAFANNTEGKVKTKSSVILSEILADSIKGNSYILASENDREFYKVFNTDASTVILSERIIKGKDEPDICIEDPTIRITYEDCRGCPAFCALYKDICQLIQNYLDKKVIKLSISKVVSADYSRKCLIKASLRKLMELLYHDSADLFYPFKPEDIERVSRAENLNVFLK